ncbi:VOC family protein [Leucobacter chromiireducens]|uniref:VOC family protein n=1 Tax=Leucobacter chromiireducens subsp. chromiireducens TaxID=660067 RepID=A0ABS1SPI1_9MICO|nr:VOC family protein [Leucobacter chromiireducens]MBL3688821.1 VOC family protein [Leucobacter chromiireducens subsp. chromiireducens]
MKINIHVTFLPHTDAESSLTFYRDVLGFELRNDVGYGDMRWLTVGPENQPETSIVLGPPAVDPGLTDDERRVIAELIAKGSYASIVFATDELEPLFARVEAAGTEILQEPMDQDWGTRDFAFRDPAGNTVRVQQL